MIRNWAKDQSAALISGAHLHRWIGRVSRGRRVPAVIGYHRVVEDFAAATQTYIPSLLISTRMLERHIDRLARTYDFVTLDEIGRRLETGEKVSRPAVALTFDDGYRDFYELAFPLLQRKGIPSALFIVADLVNSFAPQTHDLLYFLLTRRMPGIEIPRAIDGVTVPSIEGLSAFEATRTWIEALPLFVLECLIAILRKSADASHALSDSRSVTWNEIARMQDAGVTIGSHTCRHVLLPNEDDSTAIQEATHSKTILEAHLGTPVQHFAYPSGAYDDRSVDAIAAAGYKYAFTTCRHQDAAWPLLTIPRTLLWERSCLDARGEFSGPVLECLIEGAFDPISGCRQSHRRIQTGKVAA